MTIKEIVASIKAKQPEIKTVYFVGCGASQSDLFPAKYFLENNAKKLRTSIYTANNFNYSTPAGVDDTVSGVFPLKEQVITIAVSSTPAGVE